MISRTSTAVRAISAVVLVFAVCLTAGLTAGTRAAGWAAAVGVFVAAIALLARLPPAATLTTRTHERVRAEAKVGYPRFDRISAMLSWALRDARYFDRMLRPLLRDIALDLQRAAGPGARAEELRTALGERFAWLLDGPHGEVAGAARGDSRPDRAELSALLDRLDELERSWT